MLLGSSVGREEERDAATTAPLSCNSHWPAKDGHIEDELSDRHDVPCACTCDGPVARSTSALPAKAAREDVIMTIAYER